MQRNSPIRYNGKDLISNRFGDKLGLFPKRIKFLLVLYILQAQRDVGPGQTNLGCILSIAVF